MLREASSSERGVRLGSDTTQARAVVENVRWFEWIFGFGLMKRGKGYKWKFNLRSWLLALGNFQLYRCYVVHWCALCSLYSKYGYFVIGLGWI